MSIDFKLTDDDQPLLVKLIKPHRAILLLAAELPDPSYKALALHLNMPIGTVKSRLSRARTNTAQPLALPHSLARLP